MIVVTMTFEVQVATDPEAKDMEAALNALGQDMFNKGTAERWTVTTKQVEGGGRINKLLRRKG